MESVGTQTQGRGREGSSWLVFIVHDSQFTVHDSQFTVHGSRFTIHGSRFAVHGSRFAEREGREGGMKRGR